MREQYESLTRRWLEALSVDPCVALAEVLKDLSSCSDHERDSFGRLFVALVCGPRVDPEIAHVIFALAENESAPKPDAADFQSEELCAQRRLRAQLQAEWEALGRSHQADLPLMERCRDLFDEINRKKRHITRLREVLRSIAACGEREIA